MTHTPGPTSTALGAAAIGLAVLVLAGCANIQHVVQHEHEETFASFAQAERGWVGAELPSWIPEDSTDLHNLASDDESHAVIRVSTTTDPVGCTEAARHGIPVLTADWSSDEWPDRLLSCGDYEVMGVDEGWLGWFNAAEPGDTP